MAQPPPPYSAHDVKPGYVPPGVAPVDPPGFSSFNYPPQQTNIHFTSPVPPQNTVFIAPEIIVTSLGPNPQQFTCPFCHQVTRTKVQTETNSKTHLFAIFMCVFLCWPCCLIPYCVDSCKSKNHYCGNCGAFIGSYDS
ncbi:hypothetical protein RN001_010099 [Aquatica leii]|uniref:LITAF domain-containing protein n=1 Tax=Aquatica leii TaxID=1421715 RepID=A0AAN7QH88_9COLE|nr:hypothetical protein RN001_010099 [Aquatica leii]